MRFSPGHAGRQPWDSLNLDVLSQSYRANGVVPHAETVRATYTVPATREGMLTMMFCSARRATTATTAGLFYARAIGPDDDTQLEAHARSNTIDSGATLSANPLIPAPPGSSMEARTADSSTGGTVDYRVSFSVYEYDLKNP